MAGGVATNKERLLPRLRAETSALMRRPKSSTEGVNSQADEGEHYGVQARRREGEAAGPAVEVLRYERRLPGDEILFYIVPPCWGTCLPNRLAPTTLIMSSED